MWRDGSQKTAARYHHVGDTQRNRARAIFAWYGEFADKLKDYPSFASRGPPGGDNPWYGDLGGFNEVKQRLGGCRPFAWFLKRFHDIYEDGGLLPSEIFILREEQSGKCLKFEGQAGTSGTGREGAILSDCNENDDRFFWHLGNANSKGRCCSGLRAWNTDQCLNGGQGGGKAITGICNVAGTDNSQAWALSSSGQLQRGSTCLGPGGGQGTLSEGTCLSFRSRGGARWSKFVQRVPLETQLYEKALRERPEIFKHLGR